MKKKGKEWKEGRVEEEEEEEEEKAKITEENY
jgi:hypothetical protein